MNANRRSLEQWRDYVGGCLDFRPEEGIFRIARDMFTEPELFDLEMELIFEKNWIYACHESELARPHDFVTLRAGRQPLIVTRDGNGQLHALVNACQHRGATLVRVGKGNQSTFTCPFHAWCYKNDGRLVKVKAPGEYPEGFDKATRGLKKARIQSYRGFVFVSLDVAGEDDLVDFLGDARVFLDMLVAQSPSGELEVLPGTSTYTYEGNWKLQNENGLDGYHVSTVHYNYVATVQHRQQVEAERGGAAATLDYSKLGAGDAATDDGWFSFANGHSVLFSEMPNPAVRPGYASVMPRLVAEYGQARAEWMMHRLRNLNLYPSLFVIDQISSQLRIVRPLAWNRTEIVSQCI
ncbi:anthranilate 1,2-dioxygenase large subunit, partial [Pseudomonas aeruginosa]